MIVKWLMIIINILSYSQFPQAREIDANSAIMMKILPKPVLTRLRIFSSVYQTSYTKYKYACFE